MSKNFNEDYFNIVWLNEWFIYLIFIGSLLFWVVFFDCFYVVGFLIIFICIGLKLYEVYLYRDSFCFNCLIINKDEDILKEINGDEIVLNEKNGVEEILNKINED